MSWGRRSLLPDHSRLLNDSKRYGVTDMTIDDALAKLEGTTDTRTLRRLAVDHLNPRIREQYAALILRLAVDPPPQYPPLATQLATAAAAATRAVTAAVTGQPIWVSTEEAERRQSICDVCPEWDPARNRCTKCGCGGLKLSLATEACPIGKWDRTAASR
jgi:hypothetical protein